MTVVAGVSWDVVEDSDGGVTFAVSSRAPAATPESDRVRLLLAQSYRELSIARQMTSLLRIAGTECSFRLHVDVIIVSGAGDACWVVSAAVKLALQTVTLPLARVSTTREGRTVVDVDRGPGADCVGGGGGHERVSLSCLDAPLLMSCAVAVADDGCHDGRFYLVDPSAYEVQRYASGTVVAGVNTGGELLCLSATLSPSASSPVLLPADVTVLGTELCMSAVMGHKDVAKLLLATGTTAEV